MNQSSLSFRPRFLITIGGVLFAIAIWYGLGGLGVDYWKARLGYFSILLVTAVGIAGIATRRKRIARSAGVVVSGFGFWVFYKLIDMFEDGDGDRHLVLLIGLVSVATGALFFFFARAPRKQPS